VSFFEPSPPTPPRQAAHRPPPWVGPPENEFGVAVPVRLLLARTDELALALFDITAYSTGFSLRLGLRLHPDASIDPRGLMMQLHGGPMGGGDEQLRFGVEFADGRKATNVGPRRPPGEEELPISLTPRGGGGGGGLSFDVGYWVFPLPPPGKLTVAVEWPARGLPETRHELAADAILEAAELSEQLWEDERPIGRRPPPSTGEVRIS
jgi:hypothetical protein